MSAVIEGGTLLLALAAGYAHASVVESWCHDRIQHASRRGLRRSEHVPGLGKLVRDSWRSHAVVHHSMSFRADHVSRFQSHHLEERATEYCQTHGLDPANNFGLTLSTKGFVRFMLPFMAINLLALFLAPPIVSIPFVMMSLAPSALSKFVHPYLHEPYGETVTRGPLLIRCLLRTSVGRAMWVHHFLHHRHPSVCFNLLLPLGDWLRGVTKQPSAEDLLELQRVGGPSPVVRRWRV
jgi:hypothetical protein